MFGMHDQGEEVNEISDKHKARFWAKVKVLGSADSDCWVWTAYKNAKGYGKFTINARYWFAHRVSYVLAGGVLSEGLVMDHLCRSPACVRPSHLEQVDCRENVRRGEATKAVCKRGHELVGDNVWYLSGSWRRCAQCSRERYRKKKRPGVTNAVRKITDGQVKELRTLYACGVQSKQELSILYGITQQHVRDIISCKRRKLVTV